MEQSPLVPLDMPATYRICVMGGMASDYAERFWGMTSAPIQLADEPEQTALVGKIADQAALIGVINALYNMGHTVVSLERLPPDAGPRPDDTKKEA